MIFCTTFGTKGTTITYMIFIVVTSVFTGTSVGAWTGGCVSWDGPGEGVGGEVGEFGVVDGGVVWGVDGYVSADDGLGEGVVGIGEGVGVGVFEEDV